MRRLWAASAAIVMCLSPGAPVLAQEGSPTPASPVIVTGTEECGGRSGGTSTYGGVDSERGWVADCVNTMSDPRVDGTWVNTLNMDCYPGDMCLMWGTHVLDGTDGGWACSWAGADFPTLSLEGGFLVSGVCPGTGGFEGLTYVFQHGNAGFEVGSPFSDDSTFDGVIYEGPAPMVFATQSEAGK
jgi:hypothetical protein